MTQSDFCAKCCRCCRGRKNWAIILGLISIVFLVIGIAGPFVLMNLLKNQVKEQVVMNDDDADLWAYVPGKSGMNMIRKFTFYELQNPMETIFLNKTPEFIETRSFDYQEYQNFEDRVYTDDGKIVNYNFWQYFHNLSGTTGQEQAEIVNIAPLGLWQTLKTANDSMIGIQAFGQLVYGLNDQITDTIYALVAQTAAYGNYSSVKAVFDAMGEDYRPTQEQYHLVWEDPNYGLSSDGGLVAWVQAAKTKDRSGSYYILQNHFRLTLQQMDQIINPIIASFAFAELTIKNYYCAQYEGKFECNSQLLTAMQWAQQAITNNAPDGNNQPSITSQNFTTIGQPEISYFREINMNETDATFSVELAMKLLYYINSENGTDYTRNKDSLLNVGNLRFLYGNGYKYDKTNNTALKDKIKERFHLESDEQFEVFWAYMKYFVKDFGKSEYLGGDSQTLGMGSFASQALYQLFSGSKDVLRNTIITSTMHKIVLDSNWACQDYMMKAMPNREGNFTELCDQSYFSLWDRASMNYLYNLYLNPFSDQRKEIMKFLDRSDIYQLFDDDQFFMTWMLKIEQDTAAHYGCKLIKVGCSDVEMAWMQWGYSKITVDLPPILKDYEFLKESNTISDWDRQNFPVPYEYVKFSTKIFLNKLLFNYIILNKTYGESENSTLQEKFQEQFFFDPPQHLLHYLRYIIINIAFEGFTTKRTVHEHLFGYNSTLLQQLRDMNPQLGGDPSIAILVALNEPNVTYPERLLWPQSMVTGKGNVDRVRMYNTIYGYNYTTFLKQYFDGDQVGIGYYNPWDGEVLIEGGNGKYQGTEDYYGLDTFHYAIGDEFLANASTYPPNKRFYANGPCGVHNLTSILGAPVFNSLTHFQNADPSFMNNIIVYKDQEKTQRVLGATPGVDDTYIKVERYSGATTNVKLNLQGNYLLEPDRLFPRNSTVYLPLFYLNRAANMPEEKVDELFGPIKIGLKLKLIMLIVGTAVGGLLLIGSGVLIYLHKKNSQRKGSVHSKDVQSALLLKTQIGYKQVDSEIQKSSKYSENYN